MPQWVACCAQLERPVRAPHTVCAQTLCPAGARSGSLWQAGAVEPPGHVDRGIEHRWFDERVSQHMAAVDTEAHSEITIAIATVMLENAIIGMSMYEFSSM